MSNFRIEVLCKFLVEALKLTKQAAVNAARCWDLQKGAKELKVLGVWNEMNVNHVLF